MSTSTLLTDDWNLVEEAEEAAACVIQRFMQKVARLQILHRSQEQAQARYQAFRRVYATMIQQAIRAHLARAGVRDARLSVQRALLLRRVESVAKLLLPLIVCVVTAMFLPLWMVIFIVLLVFLTVPWIYQTAHKREVEKLVIVTAQEIAAAIEQDRIAQRSDLLTRVLFNPFTTVYTKVFCGSERVYATVSYYMQITCWCIIVLHSTTYQSWYPFISCMCILLWSFCRNPVVTRTVTTLVNDNIAKPLLLTIIPVVVVMVTRVSVHSST
jgi:hypothetical protein